MHGPFGEAHDEEVTESWLERHRRLYHETNAPNRHPGKKRKKRKKGGRPKKRQTPPTIRVRLDRRRICPSCQHDAPTDVIKGGQCLACQIAAYYRDMDK